MRVRVLPFPAVKKRLVLDAVVAKNEVEVAFVEVEFPAVKFWRVDEPVERMLPNDPRPVAVSVPTFAVVPKRFVKVPLVAKKEVEVPFVEVEFSAVKFWRVDEPVERRLLAVTRELNEVLALKVLLPEKVLLSARRVVDAPVLHPEAFAWSTPLAVN